MDGEALGEVLGDTLGEVLGDALGLVLGEVLGDALGAVVGHQEHVWARIAVEAAERHACALADAGLRVGALLALTL